MKSKLLSILFILPLLCLAQTTRHSASAEEVFRSFFKQSKVEFLSDMGQISRIAFYDVDGDGVSECILEGEYGSYAICSCGDRNGRPSKKAVKVVANSTPTTTLSFVKGQPWVNNQGGCGTGCYYNEFVKLKNSRVVESYNCCSTYGPEDSETHDCIQNKQGKKPKTISKKQFDGFVPKGYQAVSLEDLNWQTY